MLNIRCSAREFDKIACHQPATRSWATLFRLFRRLPDWYTMTSKPKTYAEAFWVCTVVLSVCRLLFLLVPLVYQIVRNLAHCELVTSWSRHTP